MLFGSPNVDPRRDRAGKMPALQTGGAHGHAHVGNTHWSAGVSPAQSRDTLFGLARNAAPDEKTSTGGHTCRRQQLVVPNVDDRRDRAGKMPALQTGGAPR